MGVSYLASEHRHVFHVRCRKAVSHNDREIEFLLFKEEVKNWIIDRYPSGRNGEALLGACSCEAIAERLLEQFRLAECEVSEDGENGSVVKESEYDQPHNVSAYRRDPITIWASHEPSYSGEAYPLGKEALGVPDAGGQ
jgi:hypothetical protein